MELVSTLAGPIIGGLMGGQSSNQSQQQKQELDPRMQALLYGSNGSAGLLGDTEALRKQQMAQGGLNDMQRGGLEMQRQTLMSPQYTQGYDQMRSMGSQLMGAGVAGNPFANGGNGRIPMGQPPMPAQPMQQPSIQQPSMQPFQYDQAAIKAANNPQQAAPEQSIEAPKTSPLEEYMRQLFEDNRRYQATDGMGTRNYGGGR